MRKPRVLLADDHALVLEGFQRIIEAECELVGAVEDGRALLVEASKLKPDIILLDISMPLLNGIEAARQLKKSQPDVKLIFLTMHGDAAYVTEAFRAGASGYVLKRSPASELLHAVRQVARGRFYVSPLVTKETLGSLLESSDAAQTSFRDLTERQREVLQLVAEGHSSKEIAEVLYISVKTVEFHKSNIRRAVDLRTTAELTKYAVKHGIAEG